MISSSLQGNGWSGRPKYDRARPHGARSVRFTVNRPCRPLGSDLGREENIKSLRPGNVVGALVIGCTGS